MSGVRKGDILSNSLNKKTDMHWETVDYQMDCRENS